MFHTPFTFTENKIRLAFHKLHNNRSRYKILLIDYLKWYKTIKFISKSIYFPFINIFSFNKNLFKKYLIFINLLIYRKIKYYKIFEVKK